MGLRSPVSTKVLLIFITNCYFVYRNNKCEINLLECCEKEDFKYEALSEVTTETASEAGQVGAFLQKRTYDRLSATR